MQYSSYTILAEETSLIIPLGEWILRTEIEQVRAFNSIDTLKIDRCFIHHLNANFRDEQIAIAIIEMTHSLNLKVVAEGVETESELEVLKQHHCDYIRGYLFSLPLPARSFEILLKQSKK